MIVDASQFSLTVLIVAFVIAAGAIAVAGTKLAYLADELADRTGLGEIVAGAVFVGFVTSMPGILTSVTTAWADHPSLSIGNALGGLTAQTAFLAIADVIYRKSNLEHAAASATGLTQATLLVAMLSIPIIAYAMPGLALGHVSMGTVVLFGLYAVGLRILTQVNDRPMWTPVDTEHTVHEEEQAAAMPDDPRSDQRLWVMFVLLASVTALAGFAIGEVSIGIVQQTGFDENAFGTVFTAVANSLPELVTAIASVRIGAVRLAVGNVIGGNAFEVLFLAVADFFYFEGPIYSALTEKDFATLGTVLLMTSVLLMGLLRRERHGPGNIGWESLTVLGLYGLSVAALFL